MGIITTTGTGRKQKKEKAHYKRLKLNIFNKLTIIEVKTISRLQQKAKDKRIGYWIRILSKYAATQVFIKFLGLGINFMLIRALDKSEYAYFTIANSMIFTFTLLSDSGINSGLSAIGGKIWNDKDKMGELVNTAFFLRKKMARGVILLVLPVLFWMLSKNGIDIFQGIMICSFVIIGAIFQMGSTIYLMVLKLHGQFNKLLQIDFLNGTIRIICIAILVGLTIINAPFAVFIISISLAYNYYNAKKSSAVFFTKTSNTNLFYLSEIKRLITKKLPNTIYYCISGQIGIFLLSFFGSTSAVAEVGALSRLAMVVSILTIVITNVIAPTFAKTHAKRKIKIYFIGLIGSICFITVIAVFISYLYPRQILWVLGGDYKNLATVLPFVILSAFINADNLIMSNLNASKGWIVDPYFYIPLQIGVQILGIILFDVSTVMGVVNLQLLSNTFLFAMHWIVFFSGFRALKNTVS